jgi:hypothetical protein
MLIVLFGAALATAAAGALLAATGARRKRTAALREAALRMGWAFQETGSLEMIPGAERFGLFGRGHARRVRNFMAGAADGHRGAAFDYRFTQGAGQHAVTLTQTVVCLHVRAASIPAFELRPETVFHRIGERFGAQDIDFDRHPAFSRAYVLRGADEEAVRAAFTPEVVEFFEAREKLCAAGEDTVLLLWREGKRIAPDDLGAVVGGAAELASRLGRGAR